MNAEEYFRQMIINGIIKQLFPSTQQGQQTPGSMEFNAPGAIDQRKLEQLRQMNPQLTAPQPQTPQVSPKLIY